MNPFEILTNTLRAKEILTVFARHGFAEVIQELNPPPGFLHRVGPHPKLRLSVWERFRLAAEELGISTRTVQRKIKEYQLPF